MACGRCGAALEEGDRFCADCGAPVQVSRSVIGGDRITVVLVFGAVVGLAPLFTRRFRRARVPARPIFCAP